MSSLRNQESSSFFEVESLDRNAIEFYSWGDEQLSFPEWDPSPTTSSTISSSSSSLSSSSSSSTTTETDEYRMQHGWKGSDFMHSINSPVRIVDYRVMYGNSSFQMTQPHSSTSSSFSDPIHVHPELYHKRTSTHEGNESPSVSRSHRGGVGTQLRGMVHFTHGAESHRGLCHGGAMCSVMDDVIGWTAFCVTGSCIPWSGYTVEVNTRLMKPVPLGSLLEVQCTVVKVERRKVYLEANLMDMVGKQNHPDVDQDNMSNVEEKKENKLGEQSHAPIRSSSMESQFSMSGHDSDEQCRSSISTKKNCIYAQAQGLVILNRGVLPDTAL